MLSDIVSIFYIALLLFIVVFAGLVVFVDEPSKKKKKLKHKYENKF